MRKKTFYGKRPLPSDPDSMQLLSWLLRGKTRKAVLEQTKGKRMPSDIVRGISQKEKQISASVYSQVSRSLAELQALGLVKCLNPREKTGRFYRITSKGENVLREAERYYEKK